MANIISLGDNLLSLSNGLTDVLIDYLLISGSELAVSESEKSLVVFLAEKQQSVVGIGTVGFDIIEMPWQKESFSADKSFMLNTIEYAGELSGQKAVWDKLGYEPNSEHIEYALNGFEALIKRMNVDDIDESSRIEWLSSSEENDPINCGFPKCKKHNVFLSCFGCKLCNQ